MKQENNEKGETGKQRKRGNRKTTKKVNQENNEKGETSVRVTRMSLKMSIH